MSNHYKMTFHRCFLLSFRSFGHAVSEEKIFRNRPIRNKNPLWWPCLLMDMGQNEQSLQRNFHRCFLPSFDSFGHVVSEEKIFRNRPIRNKNCLWWPYLLMDRDEMSNIYRGPSIDASYQNLPYRCFPPNFGSFWQNSFRKEDFQKSANLK